MKTILYLFLVILTPVFSFSQVHVTPPNGHVGIGTDAPTQKLDVNGNVNIRGNFLDLRRSGGAAGAYLRIGKDRTANGHAIVDLISTTTYNDYSLRLMSYNNGAAYLDHKGTQAFFIRNIHAAPMYFRTSNATRMTIHQNGRVGIGSTNPSQKLHVVGSIAYTGSLVNASDKKLKQNASEFDYGLNEVLSLSPIYYNYNGKAGTSADLTHVGLYAQDLKKAAPKLVGEFTYQETETIEDEDGMGITEKAKTPETYLNINESAIKYMLINAVKEQQTIIEELRQEVAELKDMVENGTPRSGSSRQNIELEGRKASLKQNTPNPFSSRTLVEYSLPTDTKKAAIKVYDSNGQLIYTKSIRGTGEGNLEIEAGTIPAGTYNYSLVINGEVIDTRQMVIVK